MPTLSAEVKARNHPQIPPPEIEMVRMWGINTWSCNSQGYKQMEHHSLKMARSNATYFEYNNPTNPKNKVVASQARD